MTVPVFEEYEPAADCACPGCAQQRRRLARALPVRAGGHPAAHGARRAVVLVTAAGAVLSGGGADALAVPVDVRSPAADPEPAASATVPKSALPGGAAGPTAVRATAARTPAAAARTPAAAAGAARVDRARPGGPAEPGPGQAGERRREAKPGSVPKPEPVPEPVTEPDPETPQGGQGPLHGSPIPGPAGTAGLRKMSRADIMNRAKRWVNAKVPYSMSRYWVDGYRQDCSGYVSMAWNLPGNEWTGSLAQFGVRIERKNLQPGDILLFHNPSNPSKGSHVTLFGGWSDSAHTKYVAYEQAKPNARKQVTPMAYWTNSNSYVAYRYKALKGITAADAGAADVTTPDTAAADAAAAAAAAQTLGAQIAGTTAGATAAAFPGAGVFGPGRDNKYVTQLGRLLVERGFGKHYTAGPGSSWGESDRRATQAFQRAQGWTGVEADGLPGPYTWRRLLNDVGQKNLRAGAAGRAAPAPTVSGLAASAHAVSVPGYPGRGHFRPGQSNSHVEKLRRQLVKRGFGKHYPSDPAAPGPRWSEADRRSVEAFQRAQGWRGGAADGYPGPETWRRLFS